MNDCEEASRLNAYHDGELSPSDRVGFEQHLSQCPRCAAELGRIRKLTTLFGAMAGAEMPRSTLKRMHRAVDSVRSTGVIRLAEAMAAIAATILLACVLSLARQSSEPGSSGMMPAPWELEAVTQQQAADSSAAAAAGPEESVVGWMAQDLSEKDEHD